MIRFLVSFCIIALCACGNMPNVPMPPDDQRDSGFDDDDASTSPEPMFDATPAPVDAAPQIDAMPPLPPPLQLCRDYSHSFQGVRDNLMNPPYLSISPGVQQDAFNRGIGPAPDGRVTTGESFTLTWDGPVTLRSYNQLVRVSDGISNVNHSYRIVKSDGRVVEGDVATDSGYVPLDQFGVVSLTMTGRSTDQVVMSGVTYAVCNYQEPPPN
jgi:hypothetical protein